MSIAEAKNDASDAKEAQNGAKSALNANVLVICGPSGVGKGTLLGKVKSILTNKFSVSVSNTTRYKRDGEIDGIHYNFTKKDEFELMIKNNEFIEYANVHGNYYGTSYKSINTVTNKGLICILEIDVQGAKIIKESNKLNAKYLFVGITGGMTKLRKRLEGRQTETKEQIDKRMKTAENEFKFAENNKQFFDYILMNDDLNKAVNELVTIFKKWYPKIDDTKYIDMDGLYNYIGLNTKIYDVRNKNDFDNRRIIGSQYLNDIKKIDAKYKTVFVGYGDGTENDKIKGISNDVKYLILNVGFKQFDQKYPFMCVYGDMYERYPSMILPELYCGAKVHGSTLKILKDLNIAGVLNVSGTDNGINDDSITIKEVKANDGAPDSIITLFPDATKFVNDVIKKNGTVLIHCNGGKSRATTFTMAYLIEYKKMSLFDAYKLMRKSRPKTKPNDIFFKGLCDYEIKILKTSTKEKIIDAGFRDKNKYNELQKVFMKQ